MALREVTFILKNYNKNTKNKFTYTAHTGCMGTKENSLESIDVGVENGAQIIEFDVQYYNGIPVLSHDAPKGGEITLEEAFLKVKEIENLKVNVDIKSVEHISAVKEVAEKTQVLDRIFLTGINEDFVPAVKKDCTGIDYYLNVKVAPARRQTGEYLKSLTEKVRECGAIGINFNKKSATKKLVEFFHDNGLLVSIWTVNGTFKMRKILSYGPDNITTRRPDKMKKVLE